MQISWALNFLQQQMARLWIIVNALLASDPYNVSYRPGRRLTDSQILTKETFNHFWLTLPGEAIYNQDLAWWCICCQRQVELTR